jgi:hypothetical protein
VNYIIVGLLSLFVASLFWSVIWSSGFRAGRRSAEHELLTRPREHTVVLQPPHPPQNTEQRYYDYLATRGPKGG